jgi:hypothetical protein
MRYEQLPPLPPIDHHNTNKQHEQHVGEHHSKVE